MSSTAIFIVLIFLGIILISTVSLLPKEDVTIEDEGEIIYTWLSPNGLWFSTKIFIIGFALLFIVPKYIQFHIKWEYFDFDIHKIKVFFSSLQAEVIPFNTWTKGDFLFIILYISVLVFLVNIPIRYTITTKGIYYGFLGIRRISFRSWSDVVCFDIDESGFLLLWFRPPLFRPDWSIPLPTGINKKLIPILRQYTIHYSVSRHKYKNNKIFNVNK